MFIPNLGSWFYPSRIPDPTMATEEEREKFFFLTFSFYSQKYHKILIYLLLNRQRKKFEPTHTELYFLPKKLPLSSQKYGVGIRDPEKNYPGSRGQMAVCHEHYSLQNVRYGNYLFNRPSWICSPVFCTPRKRRISRRLSHTSLR
jgi:hypothetical protein